VLQERARAQRRRASATSDQQAAGLERVRASANAELPRTAGQIQAVRAHVTALSERVEALTLERDAALADARQLARLVRHLFLSTGTAGFTSPGIQELLGAHLTAADRRQVPAAYADVDAAGLGMGVWNDAAGR
jgi:phage I-like protein